MPRQTALSGMMQSASVPRLGGPDAMIPDEEASLGANVGAIQANGWDGTIRRRALDTWCLADADRWEHIIGRLIALPPAYQAAPGRPVYIIHTSDRAVLIGEEDLTGPLRDLVITVWRPATRHNGAPPGWPALSD